ncbi:MAG: MFS transporter [Paraprevotella sp.]|nr:MFS transporter [Paraprevotella sp.]
MKDLHTPHEGRHTSAPSESGNPWKWIPTLYFAEALPYVAVMSISTMMYERLGLSNAEIAFYTSMLYLPWVIKPLWSPFIDLAKSKRWWILAMELLIAAAIAGVAFTIPSPHFLFFTLAFFWLMAFSSSTHDIAADGFYMLALDPHEQTLYVGIRSTFYRIATIAGSGLLIMLAGTLETFTRRIAHSWSLTFYVLAAFFVSVSVYHIFHLPRPTCDRNLRAASASKLMKDFFLTFLSFLQKPQAFTAILFMLFYRLPEALLIKISNLFMIKPISEGGLGLSTQEVGFVQGTVGVLGLTLGGIIGGLAASRDGLKKWLWPMVWSITLPDMVYVYLSYFQSQNFLLINVLVFIEQFGYGFGFTAYMLFLIYYSQGEKQTSHYAISTAFMALSMMLPGMVAGDLQEAVGYFQFFLIVMGCCLATVGVAFLLKINPEFGKKRTS